MATVNAATVMTEKRRRSRSRYMAWSVSLERTKVGKTDEDSTRGRKYQTSDRRWATE